MMKRANNMLFWICVLSLLPVLVLSNAWAAGADTGGAMIGEEVSATAKVEAVDTRNRTVTIKDQDGAVQTVSVPDSVKRLSEIKKGEQIVLRYRETLATKILKPGQGTKPPETMETKTVNPPGAEPGAMSMKQVDMTIKVKSVDTKNNTFVFTGPYGTTRTARVKDPEMQAELKKLKPGDNVEVVYTEALALEVKPAGK